MKKNQKKEEETLKRILEIIVRLQCKYPDQSVNRHIASLDIDTIDDMWAMSSTEFLHKLEKYEAELELDNNHLSVDDIMKDAMSLTPDNYKTFLNEGEEDNDY